MKYLVLCLLAFPAFATHPEVPETPVTPTATATASADARAVAASASRSEASVGDTIAAGGNASGGHSYAESGGNTQAVNISSPRQAPSVAQGSVFVGECGAGGNAGGSNSNGAGFLGFSFTPNDCKLLLAAAAYHSLGMVDASCEMLNGISAVKKRWKELGVKAPPCSVKPTEKVILVPTPPGPDLSAYATKEYVSESVSKAFKSTVSK